MLLLKNPQFLSKHYETRSKQGTHKYIACFDQVWEWFGKNWGFFKIKAYFWFTVRFFDPHLMYSRRQYILKQNVTSQTHLNIFLNLYSEFMLIFNFWPIDSWFIDKQEVNYRRLIQRLFCFIMSSFSSFFILINPIAYSKNTKQ